MKVGLYVELQDIVHLSEVHKDSGMTSTFYPSHLGKCKRWKQQLEERTQNYIFNKKKKKDLLFSIQAVEANSSFCSNSINLQIVLQAVISAHLLIQTKKILHLWVNNQRFLTRCPEKLEIKYSSPWRIKKLYRVYWSHCRAWCDAASGILSSRIHSSHELHYSCMSLLQVRFALQF